VRVHEAPPAAKTDLDDGAATRVEERSARLSEALERHEPLRLAPERADRRDLEQRVGRAVLGALGMGAELEVKVLLGP